ncbi:MAG: XdhC family protein, partial [Candidatus Bathyarchaeia archaeon]
MKSPHSLTITATIRDVDGVSKEFYEKVHELTTKDEIFAVATVVKTEGSTSGREGHKMIVLQDGTILFGSVGGGCVESAAVSEALQAFREGEPRSITLDMVEEEKGGVGMPCGGRLQLYVEPYLPKPALLIIGSGPIAE